MSLSTNYQETKNPQEPWNCKNGIERPTSTMRAGWVFKRLLKLFTKPFGFIFQPKIVTAGKISTDISSQSFQLDKFIINWQGCDTKQPQLYITHQDNPSKVVWSTPAGENFVGGANIHLQIFEERGSVEIEESKKSLFPNQTVDSIEKVENILTISGRLQGCRQRGEVRYTLILQTSQSQELDFDLKIIDHGQVNQAHLRFATSPDEHFYGFGEQFSRIDCKGYEVPIVVEEGGIGRGDPGPKTLNLLGVAGEMFSSYAPAAHFITNKGRSLFLINTEPSVFDLRSQDTASIRVFCNQMQGKILAADTPLELIELYTNYSGRMPSLPAWVNSGAIVGMQVGKEKTQKVREVWRKLRALNTPIAGFWLQDWVGQRQTNIGKQLWWNWQLDETTYPGWDKLVADLAQAGIAVGIYINSFLVEPPPEKLKGKRNLYQEAKEKGFLVKDEKGEIYSISITFDAALVDLSNPDAREWLKSIIKEEMLRIGAKFWMADFAEAAPFDAVFASGECGLSYHNQYAVDWAILNREAIQEAGREGEAWFFNRAGFLKTPNYSTAMWLGDQNVTWNENDGMPSTLKGLMSAGISGFSINHSDIGGYTSIAYEEDMQWFTKIAYRVLEFLRLGFKRSPELFYRWMEINAFTAIFRTHEGNQPTANIQFDTNDETLETFSYWAKVYAAFADYRQKLMVEAATKGYPLVRHLVLHYPEDSQVYKIENQFMLGSEFLIAPVLKQGANSVDVYLPAGEWIHLWSGNKYSQGKYKIDAPLKKPAVFYRQGSLDAENVLHRLKEMGFN
ncbi:MAG: alpha-glucosidase [Nostocaceae cyanobacterium]|nr:alpha-glucosidase [Nostocaceae cyanobacterium]